MYQRPPGPVPSAEEVGALQSAVVEAVLSRRPLPGGTEPVDFPDLQFLVADPPARLLDENFHGAISGGERVRLVTRESLSREAAPDRRLGYLCFQPPAVAPDEVRLTLEARLVSGDPAQRPMGLAGMQFVFRRDGDGWIGRPEAAIAF